MKKLKTSGDQGIHFWFTFLAIKKKNLKNDFSPFSGDKAEGWILKVLITVKAKSQAIKMM